MDEEYKTVIEVVTVETGEIEESKAVPVLTSNDLKKMNVMYLRSALQTRVMTTNGLKAVLLLLL